MAVRVSRRRVLGGFGAAAMMMTARLATAGAAYGAPPHVKPAEERGTKLPTGWRDDTGYPTPIRLVISSRHVNAPIELVGMDDDGTMQSPSGPDSVGWFDEGYLPGTAGSAVIAGHVDWVDRAAVFYFVRNMQAGEQIDVQFDDGSTASFLVDTVVDYPDGDMPMDQVFGPSDVAKLNLITCTGTFNSSTHNYDHRTVVYSTVVPQPAAPDGG
jgi:hypothetical protein